MLMSGFGVVLGCKEIKRYTGGKILNRLDELCIMIILLQKT